MAAEPISVDRSKMEAIIRVRDVQITFRYFEGRLRIPARGKSAGGTSTHLSDAEYAEALTLAAEKLGVKIRLRHAA